MVTPTILQSDLFIEIILPFVLVFTIVFAILQKSKILGEGKKQIDALVSLVIGLIVVSFANAVGVIVSLLPILAVSLVVILMFLLLWSPFFAQGEFKVPKPIQWTAGVIAAIVVIIAVLYVTPAWEFIRELFSGGGSTVLTNIIVIVIIGIAVVAVLLGGKEGSGKSEK